MKLIGVSGLALLFAFVLGPASLVASSRSADAAGPPYAGWAMDAYPGDSVATLKAEMARQRAAGANIVWLGHNNPGEVDATKGEPALSYAVWAAYADAHAAKHADAVAMLQAQINALTAARQLGIRVVFPVGYQIQMGAAWNAAHPGDLRRDAQGHIYWHGGNSATFYSPHYQHDILAYYHWVDSTIIRPFAATILMINLGDEPADGDYSAWADQVFRAAHGYGLRQAGTHPARQEAVGRFESDYVANYELWSATQWQTIDPAVKVTMSFDGGYSRDMHEGPDLETIFRQATPNFVVTFDTYPRDGLYNQALHDSDLISLFSLVRTLGYLSARYDRPLWLWSTGNSWGLGAASDDPGGIADAVANGIYVAQLAMQGGALQGVAVWNYNIKGQGLYNDTHKLTYDPNQMFARVSASFPLLRTIMSSPPGQPNTVILAPNEPALRAAGASLAIRATDSYSWRSLAALARDNVAAPVLTHLDDADLPALRTAIVLARSASDLSPSDRGQLRSLLAHGGTVVAAVDVAYSLVVPGAATLLTSGEDGSFSISRGVIPHGTLLIVDGGPVEGIFTDQAAPWASSVWRRNLSWTVQTQGYQVTAGGVTLFYGAVAPRGANMIAGSPNHPASGTLTFFDAAGAPQRFIHLSNAIGTHLFLPRRTYALLIGSA